MRTLDYSVYFDKVYGGWAGKCIGGTVGWFEGTKRLTDLKLEDLLPKGMMANDDLDVQLVWVDVLLSKGLSFTSSDLMRAWIDQYDYNFGEYGYSRRNFLRGIEPPVSGWYANRYYETGMGCPIRAEIWGMICPGDPDAAAVLAQRDGVLDHRGESVRAEQFIAGMVAEAFLESDLKTLIAHNLRFFPEESLSRRCIDAAITLLESGLSWREAWEALRDDFSHPDCTYTPFNMGILTLALLSGGGDIDRTLEITANAGWDVDCTCSTACALLGVIHGHAALPRRWLELVGEKIVTLARTHADVDTIRKLTETTCMLGAQSLAGGLIDTPTTGFSAAEEAACAVLLNEPSAQDAVLSAAQQAARVTPCLSIEIDYMGAPVIRAGERKPMALLIRNGGEAAQAQLRFTLPNDEFSVSHPQRVTAGHGDTRVDICVTLNKNAPAIADTNIIEVALVIEGGAAACPVGDPAASSPAHDCAASPGEIAHRFGLCGAPSVRVSRPCFDSYMDWLDIDALPDGRLLKSGGARVPIPEAGEEWGNHRVDIDKAYIDERFDADIRTRIESLGLTRAGEVVADVYRIADHYGLKGPCCVYFHQRVYSPVRREASAFVGSDNPYKLWLNGKLLHAQRANRFWYPNNDVLPLVLEGGWNDVVIKIARTGDDNRLTLAFREKQVLVGYDSPPFVVDLGYENMRCV